MLGVVVLLAAAPATAQFDRTDIADGTWSVASVSTKATSTGTASSGFFRVALDGLSATALGSYGSHYLLATHYRVGSSRNVGASSNSGNASLSLKLFAPEKMGRKVDAVKLQQKTQIGYAVFVSAAGSIVGNSTISGVLPDCGMKAQGKGTDAIGLTNQLKIKAKCKDLLTAMGLAPAAQTAMNRILGTTAITDKTLAVKSKTATYTP